MHPISASTILLHQHETAATAIMSSLAATQADGYYIPPAHFDNTKPGRQPPSKNQVAQSKGHNQFLQRGVVRFELPYSGLCQQCGQYIGRGTRFNAQKKEAGKYLTSTIWKFEMMCRNCHNQTFVIQTNPQEYGFDYVQGITKLEHKKELSTTATVPREASTTADVTSAASGGSELERLERVVHGQRTVMSEYDELQALQTLNGKTYLHDADVNAHIRSKFRTERNAHKQRVEKGKSKGWIKPGMQLLDEDLDMAELAKSTRFGPTSVPPQIQQEAKYKQLQSSSIFEKSKSTRQSHKRRRRRPTDGVTLTSPDFPSSTTPTPEDALSSQPKKKRLIVVQVPSATQKFSFSRGSTAPACILSSETNVTSGDDRSDNTGHDKSPTSLKTAGLSLAKNDSASLKREVLSPSQLLSREMTPKPTTSLLLAAYSSSSDEDEG